MQSQAALSIKKTNQFFPPFKGFNLGRTNTKNIEDHSSKKKDTSIQKTITPVFEDPSSNEDSDSDDDSENLGETFEERFKRRCLRCV